MRRGVSSDEYLNNALVNRKEWEIKGQRVVKEMANSIKAIESIQSIAFNIQRIRTDK